MPNLSEQTPSHAVGRDSQTELLRIVAMVMILILHANFLGVGAPEHADFLEDAPRAWGQLVLERYQVPEPPSGRFPFPSMVFHFRALLRVIAL